MENFRKNVAYKLSCILVSFIFFVALVLAVNFLFNPLQYGDYGMSLIPLLTIISTWIESSVIFFVLLLLVGVSLRLVAILPEQSCVSIGRWKDFAVLFFFVGVATVLKINMVSWLLFIDQKYIPHIVPQMPKPTLNFEGTLVPAIHPTLYAREVLAEYIFLITIFMAIITTFLISISMLLSEIKRLKNEKIITPEEGKVV